MRRILKSVVERTVVSSGLPRIRRGIFKNEVVILGYHNVVPEGDPPSGDSSLHLPIDSFRSQMDLLGECFDVVPLDSLLGAGPTASKPQAIITFDDAYRGALELGIPEVLSRGFSATVFVPPGLLGGPGFWWDLIADEATGSVPLETRRHALSHLGGRQWEVLRWATSTGLVRKPMMPELYRPADEAEVVSVARRPEVRIGSHTWSHVNLLSVEPNEAEKELSRTLEWLTAAGLGNELISYPYGAWGPRLEPLVRATGHRLGLLIQGGVCTPRSLEREPFALPRLNIPRGISRDGFFLRVSGLWQSRFGKS